MTDDIKYRHATANDILTICELGQMLNAIHHQARPDIYSNAMAEFDRDKQHWLPSLQDEDRVTILAELGSEAVGFITVQLIRPRSPVMQPVASGRVGSIAVSERMRGRGIGSSLMKLAEAWALKQGAADIQLMVWAFNTTAVDLYKELGYEVRAFEMGKPL